MLARNNNTPVSYWLEQPLKELGQWIKANNRLEEKNEQRRQKNRPLGGRKFGYRR
ncbi:MAG: hypothetical protein K2P33_00115 [Acutalibacter sp.]|nr:hypothetical protein [Acutalibacter sp.]